MRRMNLLMISLAFCGLAHAASEKVNIKFATPEGSGESIGQVTIEETAYGLTFTPQLKDLPPGIHGFHVHANGSCDPKITAGKVVAAGAAGGHLDPQKTGKHSGPWQEGHLGDLPALVVTADGLATYPVLAPRIKKLSEIKGKALMVHAGGDNHADHPAPLGGGGERFACGII
ncbi:MAG TPA: superoxide dismutase [Cu-Zn] SodC2 [Erwinia sp.]|uniref:superoxide dismutase [Cu-Zn] SodC n=1 Tax=Erwinia citreus TaxID=558 RepID=UPI000E8F97AD|nr:superoxide dismutase [Cu-Zn] SodC [Erwinia sp.]HBV39877.1 superoxide dismutase [Cu-Zn] SodC2 [Erwinia sp.]